MGKGHAYRQLFVLPAIVDGLNQVNAPRWASERNQTHHRAFVGYLIEIEHVSFLFNLFLRIIDCYCLNLHNYYLKAKR